MQRFLRFLQLRVSLPHTHLHRVRSLTGPIPFYRSTKQSREIIQNDLQSQLGHHLVVFPGFGLGCLQLFLQLTKTQLEGAVADHIAVAETLGVCRAESALELELGFLELATTRLVVVQLRLGELGGIALVCDLLLQSSQGVRQLRFLAVFLPGEEYSLGIYACKCCYVGM
jgi:hypothetical protein